MKNLLATLITVCSVHSVLTHCTFSTNCTCLTMGNSLLDVECHGYSIVDVTHSLPNNTGRYRYVANEFDIELGQVDFSKLHLLQELYVVVPNDTLILHRIIPPFETGQQYLFHNLTSLRILGINARWTFQHTRLPHLFENLPALETLDLSNTLFLDPTYLAVTFEGLRNNIKLKHVNLWNTRRLSVAKRSLLLLNFTMLFEPMSRSKVKTINLGYNAIQSITAGLLQYTPYLEHLDLSHNFISVFASHITTEILLHPTLVVVDMSEQGYGTMKNYPKPQAPSNRLVVDRNHEKKLHTRSISLTACITELKRDYCAIFNPKCDSLRTALMSNHTLFCELLQKYRTKYFVDIPCTYIPKFDESIQKGCYQCIVFPTVGNVRKILFSNINLYDENFPQPGAPNTTICFSPRSRIETLSVAGNHPRGYDMTLSIGPFVSVTGLQNLRHYDASYNGAYNLVFNMSANFPKLESLNVSHNFITLDRVSGDMFNTVKRLDLSFNTIRKIPTELFVTSHNLTGLYLSHNLLTDLDIRFSPQAPLEYLDVSYNFLTRLLDGTMKMLNNIAENNPNTQLMINLAGNNLLCVCRTYSFLKWLLDSHPLNINIQDIDTYTCTETHSRTQTLTQVSLGSIKQECLAFTIHVFIGVGTVLAVVVVIAILKVLHKKRHAIRFKVHTMRCGRRRHAIRFTHVPKVFLWFNERDSGCQEWVNNQLLNRQAIIFLSVLCIINKHSDYGTSKLLYTIMTACFVNFKVLVTTIDALGHF